MKKINGHHDYDAIESLKRIACNCVARNGLLAKIPEEDGVKVCFASLATNMDKFCEYQGDQHSVESKGVYFICKYSNESPKRNEDSGAH